MQNSHIINKILKREQTDQYYIKKNSNMSSNQLITQIIQRGFNLKKRENEIRQKTVEGEKLGEK